MKGVFEMKKVYQMPEITKIYTDDVITLSAPPLAAQLMLNADTLTVTEDLAGSVTVNWSGEDATAEGSTLTW